MDASREALKRAIAEVGGAKSLAEAIVANGGKPITRQAVEQWDVCPVLRVLEVERLSGISRHDLRPDIYGSAQQETVAA